MALIVEGLTVSFAARDRLVRAIDDVSFTLNEAETIGMVGESGCGKSVTGLSLMGLLPAATASGRAVLRARDGSDVDLLALPRSELPAYRGNEIAMIFQEPMTSLNPLRTIGDQVAEPMMIHQNARRADAMNRAAALLTEVGIADIEKRMRAYPHELSGGMRQRVMIAMALSCKPTVLIADEPTTALDVTIQAQILTLFQKLQHQFRMGILFITHDFGVVAEVAQRVLVMYAGQIVESGPVATILRGPRHPYTAGLLASLPRIDRPQRDQHSFYAIPGHVPELSRLPSGCRFQPRCRHAQSGVCDVPPALTTIAADHTVRCVRAHEIDVSDLA